ncbi:hypothetical protein LX64_00577 [Chitinophaga skermanii]|uniref:Uncharacterized protein n=1 Tax=Chitinophaga skermanii TaxID=331697 RepID=A0A327R2Q5_9BACT|nr:hypothetical protein [Chitinophaga skermanii]RAJ10970.1 hypothetical protein LX64_00577 [Chitinophaga skermanii]
MGKIIHLYQHLEQAAWYTPRYSHVPPQSRKATNWQAPQYESIRSHRKEFGRAAQTAADVQLAFKNITTVFRDASMYRRLSSALFHILKSDTAHKRGERTVEAGNIKALQGFEFNKNMPFRRTCNINYSVQLDRQQGKAHVIMPAFMPKHELRVPRNATHFKVVAAVHAIDFDHNRSDGNCVITNTLALNEAITEGFTLTMDFAKHDPRHLFVSVGIVFVEVESGREYLVKGNTQNTMCISHVFVKPSVVEEEEVPVVTRTKQSPAKRAVIFDHFNSFKAVRIPTTGNNTRQQHRPIIRRKQHRVEQVE